VGRLRGAGLPDRTRRRGARVTGIYDIDGDGLNEIAYAGWDQVLYTWDLPSAASAATQPWPFFHHDVKHTGVYGGPTVTGVSGPPAVDAGVDLSRPALMQNLPNPWGRTTAIEFVVPKAATPAVHVDLRVYDPKAAW